MDAATEKLNAALAAFTASLPKFGVTAHVPLLEEDGKAYDLAYGRHGNAGWILLLQTREVGTVLYDQGPLLSASRRFRVLAARHLPALLDALRVQATLEAEELEQLADLVGHHTDALRK